MTKILYISISDFGSIAGVNKWRPKEDTLLKCWCQNNKKEAETFFKENGYCVTQKEEPNIANYTFKMEEEFTDTIKHKRPKTSQDSDEIMNEYNKKIKEVAEKDNLSKKQVSAIKSNMQSKLKTECGINCEQDILNKTELKTGKVIGERNDKMYYKTIYMDDYYIYKIGGKVDGISEDDMIIEAKNRTRERNVRKNEYDLYQLLGYIFLTGKTKGKLIQKYNNKIWDSDTETHCEWGIVHLDDRWNQFYQDDLLPFFEKLKNVPSIPRNICKPFLTIYSNKIDDVKEKRYYPCLENKEIEKDILRIVYKL